jgi:hypothetical protein
LGLFGRQCIRGTPGNHRTLLLGSGLPDGAKLTFDIVPNRGKELVENLRLMVHD